MESQRCAGCDAKVVLDIRNGSTRAADGNRGEITYADADIVVWDCPTCRFNNADTLA